MGSHLGSIGLTLINTIFNLFTFLLMLRFALQAARADTLNPINQGILGLTDWLITPIQRSLHPVLGRYEYVTAIAAILVKIIGIVIILKLFLGIPVSSYLYYLFLAGLAGALHALVMIYYFGLILMVLLSWISPSANHPGAILVYQLVQPVLAPIRRIIPAVGMMDFSPMVAFLLIFVIDNFVINRLVAESLLPPGLVVGY